jgi:PAS domain S-box-containing protein
MDKNAFINSQTFYYVILSLEGKYLFANEFFKRKFEKQIGNLQNCTVEDTTHPEDIAKTRGKIAEILKGNEDCVVINIRKKQIKSGAFEWIKWEIHPLKNDKGEIDSFECIGYDIQNEMQLGTTVKDFESKFTETINHITDGYFSLDKNMVVTAVNKVAAEVMGFTVNEILGANYKELFPQEKGYYFPNDYEQVLKDGQTRYFEEFHKDLGRWFYTSVYPFKDGLIIFFKDFHHEYQLRKKLKDSSEKLKAILNSGNEATIFIDKSFFVREQNAKAIEMGFAFLGEPLKKGSDIRVAFGKFKWLSDFEGNFSKALTDETISFEKEVLIKDEITKWFFINYYPVKNLKGEIIGVTLNISEIDSRKKAELELTSQYKKLKKVAWNQSHLVRSPIANLQGLSDLILKNKHSINSEILDYIKHVQSEAQRLDKIVKEIVKETL